MIDFELSEQQKDLRDRTAAFVRDELIPLESTEAPVRIDDVFRRELVALGHAAGLVAPHAPSRLSARLRRSTAASPEAIPSCVSMT